MSMDYSGERFLPDECNGEIAIEHYQRYQLAKQLVKDKVVLDSACGDGYGSSLLAESAFKVVGLDIDEAVVEKANQKYGNSKLSYIAGSVENLPFDDAIFDIIVSYETIEHVNEKIQNSFLKEIKRVLKPDGILIISTPNKAVYTDLVKGINKFHIKEFYAKEYLEFLYNYFPIIDIFCQYPDTGYFITHERDAVDISHNIVNKEKCRYIIAICSNSKLDYEIDVNPLIHFDDSMYYFLHSHAHELESEIIKVKQEADVFEENQRVALEEQKGYIIHLEKDIGELKNYIIHLEKNIGELKSYNIHLEKDINDQKMYISHLEKEINEQKKYIAHLEKDIKELKMSL